MYKLADELEEADDPIDDDEPPESNTDIQAKTFGAFSKLASINRYDSGAFEGAEGVLDDAGLDDAGSLHVLRGELDDLAACDAAMFAWPTATSLADFFLHHEDDVWPHYLA